MSGAAAYALRRCDRQQLPYSQKRTYCQDLSMFVELGELPPDPTVGDEAEENYRATFCFQSEVGGNTGDAEDAIFEEPLFDWVKPNCLHAQGEERSPKKEHAQQLRQQQQQQQQQHQHYHQQEQQHQPYVPVPPSSLPESRAPRRAFGGSKSKST